MKKGKVDVLVGLQWGDEGKGKIIDVLAPEYNIIARFQGGPNAGHSLEFGDIKFVTHQVPSGIFWEHITNVIGNGVVLDPVKFKKEVMDLSKHIPLDDICKRIVISHEAHLILPSHRWLDAATENAKSDDTKIGTTKCGIGQTYTDKAARIGLRTQDIFKQSFKDDLHQLVEKHNKCVTSYDENFFFEPEKHVQELQDLDDAIEFLKKFTIIDVPLYLNTALLEGKNVLAEGAQGTSLDINFGDYPFVTSSSTVSAGACIGLGIPPQAIDQVFGLVKAYATRVGSGPFPTELFDETGELLRKKGNEFGATTGRPRRCGWLDLVQIKRAIMLNGVTQLVLSKADVLDSFQEVKICADYDQDQQPVYKGFPGWEYVNDCWNDGEKPYFSPTFSLFQFFIEKKTGVKITIISTGPKRDQLVKL